MLQEEFDYTVEMQAETLTRLARLNILHGNVHGAQMLSERCRGLTLVAQSVFKDKDGEGGDEKQGVDDGQAKSQGTVSLSFSVSGTPFYHLSITTSIALYNHTYKRIHTYVHHTFSSVKDNSEWDSIASCVALGVCVWKIPRRGYA